MTEHPDLLLSAHLDGALGPEDEARVRAHLVTCPRCVEHVAELAATARLIAALPPLSPTRSLVPHLGPAFVWLRPVRALGSVGAGLFLFLFLASAVLNTGAGLGGGESAAERAAEQGKFGAAASLAAQSPRSDQGRAVQPASPAPAPQVPFAARSAAPSPAKDLAATAAPTAVGLASPSSARPPVGPPPLTFLGLAVLSAIVAYLAHRRLRRA